MRDEANKAGVPPARESIWQYFVNKCADNLHIVLAMSPVGETLRTRCRNFPGLVNNCSIDWFTAWPQQALHAVASVFLGENVSWLYWLTLRKQDRLRQESIKKEYNFFLFLSRRIEKIKLILDSFKSLAW